jgi:hypothetical protein
MGVRPGRLDLLGMAQLRDGSIAQWECAKGSALWRIGFAGFSSMRKRIRLSEGPKVPLSELLR